MNILLIYMYTETGRDFILDNVLAEKCQYIFPKHPRARLQGVARCSSLQLASPRLGLCTYKVPTVLCDQLVISECLRGLSNI